MNKDKETFERIYENPGAGWTLEKPPVDLQKLVEAGALKPCKALDVGCGEGFYSIYLYSKGFDVVGIDLSERAIELARQNAKKESIKIEFMAVDVAELGKLNQKFDFVLEWSIMHLINPTIRPGYVERIAALMNSKGRYLSTCFNDESAETTGEKHKFAISPVGTKLFYTSQAQIEKLFAPHFDIIELRKTTIKGRHGQEHIANYCFMEKK